MSDETVREALRLVEKAKFLAKLQIAHVVAAIVVAFVPLFVSGDAVLYGCLTICAAILVHERFQWRHIQQLKAQADELTQSASEGRE